MRRMVGRGGLLLVLISWGIAWAWSLVNQSVPLEEPDWRVSNLMAFLEAVPPQGRPFRQRPSPSKAAPASRPVKRADPVELNAADSAGLEALPFIGPTLAGRIIRFRSALGGFFEVAQLSEVYGMDSLAFAVVSKRVEVDATKIHPLCADTASWASLRRHPYIGVQGARSIERYRSAHPIIRLDELASHPPIGDSLFSKWKPYLRCCTCVD